MFSGVMSKTDRLLSSSHGGGFMEADEELELDESDIWGCQPEPRLAMKGRKPIPAFQVPIPKKKAAKYPTDRVTEETGPASLPMTVPDWSKILRHQKQEEEEEEVEEEKEMMVPPHELVGRTKRRWASRLGMGESFSFSMEEGIGRTLKGRDLSRVRNAVWEKIGFQD